jgi:hypothetical protein
MKAKENYYTLPAESVLLFKQVFKTLKNHYQ